jgi:hypothetical protein
LRREQQPQRRRGRRSVGEIFVVLGEFAWPCAEEEFRAAIKTKKKLAILGEKKETHVERAKQYILFPYMRLMCLTSRGEKKDYHDWVLSYWIRYKLGFCYCSPRIGHYVEPRTACRIM